MGARSFWNNYKVLIVMSASLGLIHWGWFAVKSHPALRKDRSEYIAEPGIVSYVAPPAPNKAK